MGDTELVRKCTLLAYLLLGLEAFAQEPIQLEESCIVTVGNQTVLVRPDGSFLIRNISVFRSRTNGNAPHTHITGFTAAGTTSQQVTNVNVPTTARPVRVGLTGLDHTVLQNCAIDRVNDARAALPQ